MNRIILTESQFISLMESQILDESIFDYSSIDEFKQGIKRLIRNMLLVGMSISAIYYTIDKYCDKHNVSNEVKQEVMSMVPRSEESVKNTSSQEVQQSNPMADWVLADNRTVATVYNAVPEQCNADFGHTASMFRLNLNDVLSQRIIAMERTFMQSLGLKYGDVVYLEGVGNYDGVWQIQDTMNKRFAGQKKIDILVPNNIKTGLWKNVKIYKLKDKAKTNVYRSKMAPQLSRAENQKQVQQIKQQMVLKNKKRG